ncbi:hypothetical protein DUNSADRAFT_9980 [Dunaliella salina]|uniref:Encoded protein n=1 Tax=Dunaliella salina TaxID=3046 RepID=A0ABQ7GGD7_DUNSA|nr:hypothetical protein DUNSADRAFT_9980 [Dunaliella salina]|eukprot:KAF5833637.1 hypothetical protein DUNSADRAFT_9980 [Dunaliella salina]
MVILLQASLKMFCQQQFLHFFMHQCKQHQQKAVQAQDSSLFFQTGQIWTRSSYVLTQSTAAPGFNTTTNGTVCSDTQELEINQDVHTGFLIR